MDQEVAKTLGELELKLQELERELTSIGRRDTPSKTGQAPSELQTSSKLIDEAVDGGHRVLIFSQFVRALHLLRDEAKRREVRFCYLDGQTVERLALTGQPAAPMGVDAYTAALKEQYAQVARIASVLGIARKN